jgi:peptide/nickel transport system substrate-binding protein
MFTKGPNPVLLNQMTELRMMSKAWAEKNNSVDPKDIRNVIPGNLCQPQRDGHRALHPQAVGARPAHGAGAQPQLVGQSLEGNVTEIVYTPIKRGHPHRGPAVG